MILELDCGNSFIKWRLASPSGEVIAWHVAPDQAELQGWLQQHRDGCLTAARLVSVRGEEETRSIVRLVEQFVAGPVLEAKVSAERGGVQNGYENPLQLGVDRWLAMLGAYDLVRRSLVVIDLGTAVTVDLVHGSGQHLGGYIAPGLPLLRRQLRSSTSRISFDLREQALGSIDEPARSTKQCVERGCHLMLVSYVAAQIENARRHLPDDPVIFVTGGDAGTVSALHGVRHVPDLVFRGLAIACP